MAYRRRKGADILGGGFSARRRPDGAIIYTTLLTERAEVGDELVALAEPDGRLVIYINRRSASPHGSSERIKFDPPEELDRAIARAFTNGEAHGIKVGVNQERNRLRAIIDDLPGVACFDDRENAWVEPEWLHRADLLAALEEH